MEVLVAADTSDSVAMVQVWIPAGGGMPEHDHGPSEIILVHLPGSIELQHGDEQHRLEPGAVGNVVQQPGPATSRSRGAPIITDPGAGV
jgi:anti-sigma factor ChrR (cupin superfamily)